MNAQEIFDTVVRHLRTQGKAAADGGGNCFYRKDGLKCAVGCLIPDEYYTGSMEGLNVARVLERPGFQELRGHLSLLRELQHVHDNRDPHDWELELLGVAGRNGLVMP